MCRSVAMPNPVGFLPPFSGRAGIPEIEGGERGQSRWTIPRRIAMAAASVRSCTDSLARMLLTSPWTVSSLILRPAAISLFRIPRATSRKTSISRLVKAAWNMRLVSRCATSGGIGLSACRDFAYKSHDFLGKRVFQQIGDRPGLQRPIDVLVALVSGHYNDLGGREFRADRANRFDTAHIRHPQIHERDVRLMLAILLQAFPSGRCRPDHGHIRFRADRRRQSGADHRMIIDYQNSNLRVWQACSSITRRTTDADLNSRTLSHGGRNRTIAANLRGTLLHILQSPMTGFAISLLPIESSSIIGNRERQRTYAVFQSDMNPPRSRPAGAGLRATARLTRRIARCPSNQVSRRAIGSPGPIAS